MYEARIERDSITTYGERLTTFVVTLPRIVLAELNTHKMISKSSASSRAIPVNKQIARVIEDPFEPVHWGKNQSGMQAEEELAGDELARARSLWGQAREAYVFWARELLDANVHKQITNRLIEAFMWHTVIVSATDWSNFFNLRDHKKAQPEIAKAAGMMNELYRASRPRLFSDPNQWALPFVDLDGRDSDMPDWKDGEFAPGQSRRMESAVRCSVGRCARVSYLNHDGVRAYEDDFRLAGTCAVSGHMAPYEHVARPMTATERDRFSQYESVPDPSVTTFTKIGSRWTASGRTTHYLGNFNGWVQARKLIFMEHDALSIERETRGVL